MQQNDSQHRRPIRPMRADYYRHVTTSVGTGVAVTKSSDTDVIQQKYSEKREPTLLHTFSRNDHEYCCIQDDTIEKFPFFSRHSSPE